MNIIKNLLSFLLLFAVQNNMFAQPSICVDPVNMTSLCEDACIICDIDGFEGRHDSNVNGWLPNDFCTSTVHNAQWIAFQAGSENLTIELQVSECQTGWGLEITIYEGINCQNFKKVANCLGSVSNNTTATVITNQPLTIGQYYYLVMDGNGGDNCDWKLKVTAGTTEVDPLEESGDILGNDKVCPAQLQQYLVDFPIGATEFDWSLNGSPLNINASEIDYEFPSDGTYTLCVTSKNACDEAPPSCKEILVESIPPTEITDVFCENDCYIVAGDTICETGIYQYNLQNSEGCDSLVIAELTKLTTPYLFLDINICEGDVITVGNSIYSQTGIYQEALTSFQACDSIIDLDLLVIVCNIQSSDFPTPTICFGSETGQINFNVDNGTPPFTYTYENLNATHSGSGNINAVGEMISINNIPKGTYLITINDTFGNNDIIISEVGEPSLLTNDFLPSDNNGFNISCNIYNDGSLQAIPTGGIPPYNFSWSNGINGLNSNNTISNLTAGEYSVTISDDAGCTLISSYTLTQPEPLFIDATFINAECEGLNTGSITINQTDGGVAPYSYFLDGEPMGSGLSFEELTAGNYIVEVMDDNGCISGISGMLTAPQIPEIDLGEDYTIALGELINFNPSLNSISIQNIQWSATELLSCEDCLNPEVLPFNSGSYLLEIISADGCSELDSIFISVEKLRRFYAPNAFSPNYDGFNDTFTLFGGPEVAQIKSLTIFNRWGAVVFEGTEMEAGDIDKGWNGEFNNQPLNSGVFAWIAEIEFIDGVIESFSGDVTIVL